MFVYTKKGGAEMEWLKRLNAAIDYIESHLEQDISYDEAARIADVEG